MLTSSTSTGSQDARMPRAARKLAVAAPLVSAAPAAAANATESLRSCQQRQELAREIGDNMPQEVLIDFMTCCTRPQAPSGLVFAFLDFAFEHFDRVSEGWTDSIDIAATPFDQLVVISKALSTVDCLLTLDAADWAGKSDVDGCRRSSNSLQLASATLERVQRQAVTMLAQDEGGQGDDLRRFLQKIDRYASRLYARRYQSEWAKMVDEYDALAERLKALEDLELSVPPPKGAATSLKVGAVFRLEKEALSRFLASDDVLDARTKIHVIPRRDRNKKDEEEEYFVPLALGIEPSKSATKHRESSTSHRDEASIPSPPEQEASTSTLRLGAPFVQVRGKQKTTRRDTLVPPPEAASLLESRRVQPTASGSGLITRSSSNLAAESVQEEEEEGQEVDPETTIVPPTSSVRSKEKGKTAASSIPPPPAAWTTKQESLSPDLPDVEEVWRNPSRWATTSPSGKGKAKALLESVRSPVRESRSTLSSLSSIRSGTDLGHHFSSGDAPKSSRKRIRPGSEADRQDFRSNPRRTSAITARSLTQTALSSPSRGKRNLEGTHTKTSPRKKKKLQTATEPEPVLRTKASPAPIALPSAFNFDVHAIVIDSDEDFGIDPEDSEVEEDSLPSDYENGRDGEYIVEKVLEVRKVGKKGAGSWMYKVRWEGYGPEDDTWQDYESIKDSTAYRRFHTQLKLERKTA